MKKAIRKLTLKLKGKLAAWVLSDPGIIVKSGSFQYLHTKCEINDFIVQIESSGNTTAEDIKKRAAVELIRHIVDTDYLMIKCEIGKPTFGEKIYVHTLTLKVVKPNNN